MNDIMRDIMLIIHFIGLILGIGSGFAFMFLGISSAKMDGPDRTKFMLNTLALSMMGKIGLTLLIISGLYLMTPYWGTLFSNHILMTKLFLVIVLIILMSITMVNGKRAKSNDGGEYLMKMSKFGRMTLITGLLVVIFAVLNFH